MQVFMQFPCDSRPLTVRRPAGYRRHAVLLNLPSVCVQSAFFLNYDVLMSCAGLQGIAGTLFFWTYELLVFMVLLNFLLAIIVDAFSEVKEQTHETTGIHTEVRGRQWCCNAQLCVTLSLTANA